MAARRSRLDLAESAQPVAPVIADAASIATATKDSNLPIAEQQVPTATLADAPAPVVASVAAPISTATATNTVDAATSDDTKRQSESVVGSKTPAVATDLGGGSEAKHAIDNSAVSEAESEQQQVDINSAAAAGAAASAAAEPADVPVAAPAALSSTTMAAVASAEKSAAPEHNADEEDQLPKEQKELPTEIGDEDIDLLDASSSVGSVSGGHDGNTVEECDPELIGFEIVTG